MQEAKVKILTSDLLRGLFESSHAQGLTIEQILYQIGGRSFGLGLILLAIPTFIPVLPPGTSAVVGVLILLLSVQLLCGRETIWLPARVRKHKLHDSSIRVLQKRALPILRILERYSRPRLIKLFTRSSLIFISCMLITMGLLIFSPIPLLNALPGVAVLLIGLGIAEGDGLYVLLGILLATAILIAVAFSFRLIVDLGFGVASV